MIKCNVRCLKFFSRAWSGDKAASVHVANIAGKNYYLHLNSLQAIETSMKA